MQRRENAALLALLAIHHHHHHHFISHVSCSNSKQLQRRDGIHLSPVYTDYSFF